MSSLAETREQQPEPSSSAPSDRRQDDLKALECRIKAEHARMKPLPSVWFWPGSDGVKGFLGTAPVIVAGLNPSKGRRDSGPHETDKFFYDCLREEGLAEAHVTDIVKVAAVRDDVPLLLYDPTMAQLHREYFEEEVRIVQPVVVVVLGHQVLDVLRGWHFVVPDERKRWVFELPRGRKAEAVLTVHPAATRWPKVTAERRARFRRDVREARQLWKEDHVPRRSEAEPH